MVFDQRVRRKKGGAWEQTWLPIARRGSSGKEVLTACVNRHAGPLSFCLHSRSQKVSAARARAGHMGQVRLLTARLTDKRAPVIVILRKIAFPPSLFAV